VRSGKLRCRKRDQNKRRAIPHKATMVKIKE